MSFAGSSSGSTGRRSRPGPLLVATMRSLRARVDYAAGSIDLGALRERTREEVEFLAQMGIATSRSITMYFLDMFVPWLEGDTEGHLLGRRRTLEAEAGMGTNLYLANILGEYALALCEAGDRSGALAAIERGRAVMEPGRCGRPDRAGRRRGVGARGSRRA